MKQDGLRENQVVFAIVCLAGLDAYKYTLHLGPPPSLFSGGRESIREAKEILRERILHRLFSGFFEVFKLNQGSITIGIQHLWCTL